MAEGATHTDACMDAYMAPCCCGVGGSSLRDFLAREAEEAEAAMELEERETRSDD